MPAITKQELQNILDRYLDGIASESETRLVENFYSKIQTSEEGWTSVNDEKKKQLRSEIFEAIQKKKARNGKVRINPLIWKLAASFVIVCGMAMAYYLNPTDTSINYIVKSTTRGQKATVTLNDGSIIRLNAQSTIRYPEVFSEEKREILLKGEAFFEVKKDIHRPFIVTSHTIQTTVLGTTFNINAYEPSNVSVSLVTGKVSVETIINHSKSKEIFLTPGESAVYDSVLEEIKVSPFEEKQMIAWKDGILFFSGASYEEVFERLKKWYGIDFQFVNKPAEKWEYSGEFRDMSLELVLKTIGYSKGFEFDIQNNIVQVKFEN